MKPPYYTGRSVEGRPRVFYVSDDGETDITYILQRAGITFDTRLDWHGTGAELAELAQTVLWHMTRSHELVFRWGRLLAWDLMCFLSDGWKLSADELNDWLGLKIERAHPLPAKGNGTAR